MRGQRREVFLQTDVGAGEPAQQRRDPGLQEARVRRVGAEGLQRPKAAQDEEERQVEVARRVGFDDADALDVAQRRQLTRRRD